jgi:hypothetical protein
MLLLGQSYTAPAEYFIVVLARIDCTGAVILKLDLAWGGGGEFSIQGITEKKGMSLQVSGKKNCTPKRVEVPPCPHPLFNHTGICYKRGFCRDRKEKWQELSY